MYTVSWPDSTALFWHHLYNAIQIKKSFESLKDGFCYFLYALLNLWLIIYDECNYAKIGKIDNGNQQEKIKKGKPTRKNQEGKIKEGKIIDDVWQKI